MYHAAGYSSEEIFSTFDVLMYSYLPFDEVEVPLNYFTTDMMYVPKSLFPDKKYAIKAVEDYDDSNSSHPNIKKRKEAVGVEIGTFSNWENNKQFLGEDRFTLVRTIARFESVRSDIIDANYGKSMYSVFLLEQEFPNSIYLKRMKAQIWLNLMLYKSDNKATKTVSKTADFEGESAAIHFFLKKLNREGMMTMALRQIYDLHKAFPENEEISVIYTKLVKELTGDSKFKIESYSKKTFDQAATDFINTKTDTSKSGVKDTLSKPGSKYDKIKSKKNADAPENFDSTKFYLYGIVDILKDSAFLDLHAKFKKEFDEKTKEQEAYEAMSRKERNAVDKKNASNESRLGIKEFIVVEPMVISYKHGRVDNIKSEKLERDFSEAIETSAQEVGITTYAIDSRSLTDKGTQGFNERSILISMLNQLALEEDLNIFPVDYQLLKSINSDYGTSKVMFSLVEHEYAPNLNVSGIFSSLLLYPVLFVYVPLGILTGNNTEMNVLILDLKNGEIENGISYYFKDSPKKLQLGAHMYDIFKRLSSDPIN